MRRYWNTQRGKITNFGQISQYINISAAVAMDNV